MHDRNQILVLGIGNTLLTDDGFGVHVINAIAAEPVRAPNVLLRDGGTLGLSLLPDIEDSARLIVVDAGEIGAEPGEMRVYFGAEMDAHLSTCKGTVHEVAMTDLLQAARMSGHPPHEQALIVVQPAETGWGEAPTDAVAAAIPRACAAIEQVIANWQMEAAS